MYNFQIKNKTNINITSETFLFDFKIVLIFQNLDKMMLPSPQEMIDVLNNLKTEPRTSVFACSGRLLALTVVVGEHCHWRRTYSLANGMNVDYLEDHFFEADPEVAKFHHLEWLDLAMTPNMFDECLVPRQ